MIFFCNRWPEKRQVSGMSESSPGSKQCPQCGAVLPAGARTPRRMVVVPAADTLARLEAGCRFAVQQPAYTDLAKRLHQGSHYYAGATAFAKRLDADVVDKKELLQRIGLVK